MYKLFLLLFVVATCFSCSYNSGKVVKEELLLHLLQQQPAQSNSALLIEKDIYFWQTRIAENREENASVLKLASLYSMRFHHSGLIGDIIKSDSLYKAANQLQKFFSSGVYRALAANAVTQHRFKDAERYIDTALTMGDNKYLTLLQAFDIKLELGQQFRAEQILQSIHPKNNFDYYIRASKLEDHKGNSEESIRYMEKAYADVADSRNTQLLLWVKTNLADMYGHQNRINDAYRLYNEVISSDANYYHAWKGIAWLAFSNDKNTNFAKTILHRLQKIHPIPDYDLMLSEIAGYENNITEKNKWLLSFIKKVQAPGYGDMYNKYLFNILTDEYNNPSAALLIAQKEIQNRPTAQSYDMLAWSLYKSNRLNEAVGIANGRVINKTFEPDALYHIGLIFKKAGNNNLAKYYLGQALESSFELGPQVTKNITQELQSL
ncbi:hypothetical protein ESA94_14855 [Lacibacter luteus]|uniref:Cell surface protein n=1 Tax=Lacibacter luteus TaxID=2508719 RepID=A0A4Q1CGW5_9BACT|nr:hypothetical protein [Lacibacter luteus]RXK59410.1 hypothetical protein ESA94_14855 [Lacibacter luteus]